MQTVLEPRDVTVRSEMDIVNLRHSVRQVARTMGLDLTRQAKITAAISAVARAFIHNHNQVVCTVQVIQQPQRALQVMCAADVLRHTQTLAQIEGQLNVQEVRMLVDDFDLTLIGSTIRLTIRMRLGL